MEPQPEQDSMILIQMKKSEALNMGLIRGGNPTLSVGPSYVLPPPKSDGSSNQVSIRFQSIAAAYNLCPLSLPSCMA
jgi:hypothetical protein